MNNRENTMAVLTYRDYTRIPVVSFGYWAETVMKWLMKAISDGRKP